MTIVYGTATAERIIRRTPRGYRVGFLASDTGAGTEAVYALHPVTRDIRMRVRRIGAGDGDADGWREAHHIPPGAAYLGRCRQLSDGARIVFGS